MRLTKHLADQTNSVIEDAKEMGKLGFEEYLSSM